MDMSSISPKPAKRIGSIDMLKAIALLFIVVCHMGLVYPSSIQGGMPDRLVRFAFTFHLPVFFIASGIFFRGNEELDLQYIKKQCRRLLAPYCVACLFVITGSFLLAFLRGESPIDEAIRWAQASIWGAGARRDVALWDVERIGGIWFLLALFWIKLILAATNKMGDAPRLLFVLALMGVSVFSNQFIWLPLSLQSGLGCSVYFYVGFLIKKYRLLDRLYSTPSLLVFPGFAWGICIAFGGRASLAMGDYPLGIIDVIGGVSAFFCLMWICHNFEETGSKASPAMEFIGRITMPLFALHIVEDNLIHWGRVSLIIGSHLPLDFPSWIVVLTLRLALIALLAFFVYLFTPTRKLFYGK